MPPRCQLGAGRCPRHRSSTKLVSAAPDRLRTRERLTLGAVWACALALARERMTRRGEPGLALGATQDRNTERSLQHALVRDRVWRFSPADAAVRGSRCREQLPHADARLDVPGITVVIKRFIIGPPTINSYICLSNACGAQLFRVFVRNFQGPCACAGEAESPCKRKSLCLDRWYADVHPGESACPEA